MQAVNKINNKLWGLALLLATSAQAKDHLGLELDRVVITGTRTEQVLSESPVRTEIISRDDIERHHARNLHEAINLLPGALIHKVHGKTGYEVWLQGVDSNRVLVLIDGEPVSASTGTTVDLTQIGTINIDRIEVVKGATSALYGSNAIGGVINIITRKPSKAFSYSIRGDMGSFGSQNVSGNEFNHAQRTVAGYMALKKPTWFSDINFDVVDSDGFKPYNHHWDQLGPKSLKGTGRLSMGFTPSVNQEYVIAADYYLEDTRYQTTRNNAGKPDYRVKREEADRTTYKVAANWWLDHWGDIQLRYFNEVFDDTTEQDSISTDYLEQQRDAELTTHKFMSQWTLESRSGLVFTSGIDYVDESLRQQTRIQTSPTNVREFSELAKPSPSRHNIEFFHQADIYASERLQLLPGFRWQNDSDFGDYLTPKLNGRFKLGDLNDNTTYMLRFGVGKGYRVPSLKERYYKFDHSQNGYVVNGNPDLQPESSKSFQLGWVISKPNAFSVDLNIFYNKLVDLIEVESSEPPSASNDFVQQFLYVNVRKAKTQGGEVSGTFIPNNQARISLAYTYLESQDLLTGNHLGKRPRHQVKSSVDYSPATSNFTFSIAGQWQSKAWYDLENQNMAKNWSRFDFKVNYQFNRNFKIYGGIDNIFSAQKDFTNHFDLRPEQGRFVYLGLQLANI